MLTIQEILEKRIALERQLTYALMTMEKKSEIMKIRKDLLALQKECPHNVEAVVPVRGKCPYCEFPLKAIASSTKRSQESL